MGDALNMKMSAANAQSQAAAARSEAIAAKRQAMQNAYNVEFESAQRGMVAGENMEVMRKNQTQRVANEMARQGGSGFAVSSGSKMQNQVGIADMIEQTIQNMLKSNSIADQNARMQANVMRRQGETAYNVGMVKADYMNKQADILSKASTGMLIGSGLNLLGNVGMQFNWKQNEEEAYKPKQTS